MTSRLKSWKPFLLFFPFGLLYRYSAAGQFSYDGVLYALDVEFGTTAQLFHPGHLLYSFFFRELGRFFHVFGYSKRAIFLMQDANAWIAALAVALLAMTLSRRFGEWRGTLVAGLFGFSQVFWSEAIDPGCYALAGLAAVCLLMVLLRARVANAWQIGLLHGFLILFHQLLIFAIPAFWAAIYFGEKPAWRRIVRYMGGVLLVTGLSYAYVASRFHPGPLSEQLKWFLIPAGTPSSVGVLGGLWWNWNGLSNIRPFWDGLAQSFIVSGAIGNLIAGLLAVFILVGTFRHASKGSELWPDLAIAWAWIMPLSVFLFFFHHALRFHVLILPPFLYLLAALSTDLRGRRRGVFSAAGLVILGVVNYSTAIAPRHSAGEQQTRLLWVRDHVRPIDFLLFSGRGPHSIINVYMAYFLPQIPARSLYGYLLTQFDRPEASMDTLSDEFKAAWSRGGRVWAEKDLLDSNQQGEAEMQMKVTKGSVSGWFKKYKKRQEISGPEGYYLVELTPVFQDK